MFSSAHNFKVFNPIVMGVTIDMVDNHVERKFVPKNRLHNFSMEIPLFACLFLVIRRNIIFPTLSVRTFLDMFGMTFSTAIKRLPFLAWFKEFRFFAVKANNFNSYLVRNSLHAFHCRPIAVIAAIFGFIFSICLYFKNCFTFDATNIHGASVNILFQNRQCL